jgi:HTH-type transcriptional regulator/antitoxin HigA
VLRNKTTVSGAPKDGRQNILTPVNFVYAFKTHIVIDLKKALATISDLMESEPALGSDGSVYLDILATLVEAYERKSFPLDPPNLLEAIRFRMEQGGLKSRDLVPLIGNANRVYEVLNGKRPLTLRMIRNIHRELGIPAEVLVA